MDFFGGKKSLRKDCSPTKVDGFFSVYAHAHLPHPATQPYSVRTLHFVELRQEGNSLL